VSVDAKAARELAGPASALVAAGWWLAEVTRSWAGRDAPSVTVGAILVAVSVLLVRPDRALPWRVIAIAVAISTGAYIVPLTAPSGWDGAKVAAIYVCGVWLAVVATATVVRRPDFRDWFATLIVASAAIEFMSGWLGWWGGENASRLMVGTFYWHNSFAAFLVPGGLIGLGSWIWRERMFALLGVISFVLATVGVVYSTSRASLACLAGGAGALAVMAVVDRRRLRAIRQLAIAAAVAIGSVYFVAGPPFFPHRVSPFAGEQARAAGQSLGQNGSYRLDFWHEALTVFKAHPLTGGGYKSLVAESNGRVPGSWPLSPFAHNGYLQALADGGLVLAVPFLLAVVVLAVLAARSAIRCVVRRDPDLSGFVVPVAFAAVLLHSGVDFDWTYAANFAMAALLGGLVLGQSLVSRPAVESEPASRPLRPTVQMALTVLAGVGLLAVSACVMRSGDHKENLPTSRTHSSAANQGPTATSR
jgi:O-antigen ligase